MIDGYGSARSVAGPSLPQTKIYAQVGRLWRVLGYASSAARAMIESSVRAKPGRISGGQFTRCFPLQYWLLLHAV